MVFGLGTFTSWFKELLTSFGVLSRKKAKICFLGLDNAGKTTLLHRLKNGRLCASAPTLHPGHEELIIDGIGFTTYDLGGHETARRIWEDYCVALDGIIFIVDAADRTRFEEAKQEIAHVLELTEKSRTPFAVLGNKIDIPVAASEDELRQGLGLYQHMTVGKDAVKDSADARPINLFMCSVIKEMGYSEAFQWLSKLV